MIINHSELKVYVTYRAREENNYNPVLKIDEIIEFYKTLKDPYIPFPEYSLGIKDKER